MSEINTEYLTIKTGVVLPGLQALVNGAFYGIATGGLCAVANALQWLSVPPWSVGVTVGSLAGLRAWVGLLDDWRILLYGRTEPEPLPAAEILPHRAEPIRVELSENEGRSMQFLDLPVAQDQFIALAVGVVSGLPFTEAQWTGGGAPFSRSQFVQLRGEMLRRGLLDWNSQNDNARGVRVTGKGLAVMRHFASASTHPPTLRRRR